MKVIKDIEHGLLVNHFGLAGKYYLGLTVLTFFSFHDPDAPLSEQALWPFVQGELGKDAILDGAMPKLKGEVIVWGRCFTPGGAARNAAEVQVRVGTIDKTLNVFGDRYWRRAGGTAQVITDPLPFTEMPVSWDRAFGGAAFGENPVGKGLAPVMSPAGEPLWPLPNIEAPGRLIGAPSDRPSPAGLAPIDLTWPQRMKKAGTYDNRWREERWPFYPDDMDWTFFNAAPEDQQVERWFEAGESITVRGMHRDKPVQTTTLPRLRQRCFINQIEDMARKGEARIFKEVTTHIDTLWLFPHAERGIAIYRGSTAVADDEALDVEHLFIATEPVHEPAGGIEHYHAVLLKRLDRGVPAAMAGPMEKAHQKLAAAADRLKDLPLEISDAIARNLGEAPRVALTPHEVIQSALSTIDASQQRFDTAEARVAALKATHGHFMKIDTAGFETARRQFADAKNRLQSLAAAVDDTAARQADTFAAARDRLSQATAGLDPALLKGQDVSADAVFDAFTVKKDPWQTSGMRFLEVCRRRLLDDPVVMAAFRALGYRPYTLKRAWIGLNPEPVAFPRKDWGLAPGSGPNPDKLAIPTGLVIPCFDGARIDSIRVRPFGADIAPIRDARRLAAVLADSRGDIPVEGSTAAAMALGAGDKAFVRVAEVMDALLLHQDIREMAAVVAMKTPDDAPPETAAAFLKDAPQLLVAAPPGDDAPKTVAAWQPVCPAAQVLALPQGDTLVEARKAGLDLWQWVADALNPALAPSPEDKPKTVDAAEPGAIAALVPVIDVEGIIAKVRGRLTGKIEAQREALNRSKNAVMADAQKQLAAHGIDPAALSAAPPSPVMSAANPYRAAKAQFAEKITALKGSLAEHGTLTPEVRKALAEVEGKNAALLDRAAGQYDEGKVKLAAVKAKAAAGPPQWARKLQLEAGLDPDDPAPLQVLDRDAVLERLERGAPLSGKNMTGADLSGLDFTGIDLKRANLQKASLNGSRLDGADLSYAIANEADFSGASMREAKMVQGLFQKALFKDARMTGGDLTQALMNEADLTGADLTGARINKALLEKAKLTGAKLVDADAAKGYFLSTDVSGADFSGAEVTKAVFLKANIDQADFSHATVRGTIFIESTGEKLRFAGADMHNSRILNASAMTGSDFTGVNAERACWMKSDLSGSDFRGAGLKRGLIQECDLGGCDLSGVSAKQARLTKTDLSDADLKGVNLMHGSLRKSRLVRTDLTAANLYGAEFYKTGVGETRFEGANLKMTKLYKRTDLIAEIEKDKK